MTTNLTGGVISIEDGKKAAEEFAPARKVRVELHFDLAEGDDAVDELGRVAGIAQAQVSKLLGGKLLPSTTKVQVEVPAATGGAATLTGAPVKTAAEQAKADALKAAHAGVPTEAKVPPKTKKAAPKAPVVEDELGGDGLETVEGDELDELVSAQPAKEITDADLSKATKGLNERVSINGVSHAAKIREVIQSYMPGKAPSTTQIPQASRQEYLDKLDALEKTIKSA